MLILLLITCCTRVLLNMKMLKEIETEETIVFVVINFITGDKKKQHLAAGDFAENSMHECYINSFYIKSRFLQQRYPNFEKLPNEISRRRSRSKII